MATNKTKEDLRLQENYSGKKKWLDWGPYLSERQWGTVREDYSQHGTAWDYFPHEHARSRVYRWGEDGIAGISDKHCAICFAVAMWNGKDPILKERLFGLTGNEGNHGEDVKELYYYLDNTPTHSYMKHLYKYPHAEFPYADLVHTNANRGKDSLEYEILDTGVFNDNRYFDVVTEYAKVDEEDILIKITAHNRGPEAADMTLLPTLWLRNLWSFGKVKGEHSIKKNKDTQKTGSVVLKHPKLGTYHLHFQKPAKWLFTQNETNTEKLYGHPNETAYVKDLFHDAVINNDFSLTDAVEEGTKFSPMYRGSIGPGEAIEIRLRFSKETQAAKSLTTEFDKAFDLRREEANEYYENFKDGTCKDTAIVQRQAFAGMLWTKQYYNIDMYNWIEGDPGQPAPPPERKHSNRWRACCDRTPTTSRR